MDQRVADAIPGGDQTLDIDLIEAAAPVPLSVIFFLVCFLPALKDRVSANQKKDDGVMPSPGQAGGGIC